VADAARGSLVPRILTALVLVALALGLGYLGGPYFAAVVAAAAGGVFFEIERMAGALRPPGGPAVLALATLGGTVAATLEVGALCGLAVAGLGVALVAALELFRRHPMPWRQGASLVALSTAAVALVWLREYSEFGRAALFWLFAVVWASDTGAFLIGRLIGGPRLAPRISPNKTLAGAAGGLLAALGGGVLVAAALAWIAWLPGMPPVPLLLGAAAATSLAAQLGDLAESAIKRHYGVKDSGVFLPGHGGLFDRLDSLIAAGIVYALIMHGHG